MSIRDINKKIVIQDMTTGVIKNTLDFPLFTDYGEQEYKISVGDFLLLQNLKSVLNNERDCLIKVVFKSD